MLYLAAHLGPHEVGTRLLLGGNDVDTRKHNTPQSVRLCAREDQEAKSWEESLSQQ